MKLATFINNALHPLGVKVIRLKSKNDQYNSDNRYDVETEEVDGLDRGSRKILNLINYTKQNNVTYNADPFESAYHSIKIGDREFLGQRNPKERFKKVTFDFTNATVLDIGCNQGGMLFEISDQIRHGIGIDYDHKMINAANRIRSFNNTNNIDFYKFDLQEENLEIIKDFLPDGKLSIVFLLSVCMWIKNWREVIDMVASISDALLFESNGSPEQQAEQEELLRATYKNVDLLQDQSPDDPQQKMRKLFLCQN